MKKLLKYFLVKTLIAFNLAEVLIVLGIIGVLASMLIPPLSKNIRHYELQQQFKKSYATMSEAVAYTKMDLGGEDLYKTYATYNGTSYPNAAEFGNAFYNRLKIVGDKTYHSYSIDKYSKPPRNYNNTADADWSGIGHQNPSYLLPDGSFTDCYINAFRINITVDINGPFKKPNRAGYDIFHFEIYTDNRLRPAKPKEWDTYFICDKTSTSASNGLGCAYYALIDKNPNDNTKGYWESLD